MENKYITKLLINIWMPLLTLAILTSCTKDSPFDGYDKHIVSFSLTVEGIKYQGEISGTDIIINAPTNIDLTHATVEYTLSENAKILPDPDSIEDWNNDQIFRLQAYNNDYISYKYSVNRTDIVDPDNVTLLTQADVDAFALKKINSIAGNLIIGTSVIPTTEYDTIKDLSGLSSITEVEYNVVINNSFGGADLSGLSNLKKTGGIYIGSTTTVSTPLSKIAISLPDLEKSSNIIVNCDSITQLSLPSLSSVGNLYVNSILLSNVNLSSLQNCSGDLTIKAITGTTYSEAKSNQVLKSLSLPVLEQVGGTLWLENFWMLASLDLPKLSKVSDDLQIKYIRTIKTIDLPALLSVAGTMNIQANDGMVTFLAPVLTDVKSINIASVNVYSINLTKIDFTSLGVVDGDFIIQYAGTVSMSFPKLRKVTGTLQLSYLQFLESAEVPALQECEALKLQSDPLLSEFDISKVAKLNTLDISTCVKLSKIKSPDLITGNVSLNGGSKVCNFTQFEGLSTIGGTLTVASYNNKDLTVSGIKSIGAFSQTSGTNLTSLALPDVETIGDITITSMTKLATLSAPKLKTVNSLNIKGLLLLNSINLQSLTKISGTFTFYGATSSSGASSSVTTNMNGFSSLTSVGMVDIRYAGMLNDFSGLKNIINSLNALTWAVQGCKYNPTYQDMVNGKYTE